MVGNKLSLLLAITAVITSLSGCTQSLGGCGVGYEEMYGGYDYDFSKHDIANDNSLNVTVRLQNGGGGWIEDSDEFEDHHRFCVSLNIIFCNGIDVLISWYCSLVA